MRSNNVLRHTWDFSTVREFYCWESRCTPYSFVTARRETANARLYEGVQIGFSLSFRAIFSRIHFLCFYVLFGRLSSRISTQLLRGG